MLSSYTMEEFRALETHFDKFDLPSLGCALHERGVVQLPGFLPSPLHQALEQQVNSLLDTHGKRVDVRVRSTGNTPRKYVSVSRHAVFEHSSLISQLYFDPALMQFFAALAGTEIIPAPYEPEQVVVNLMNQEGDTHGWHWDDYTYSVVLVLAAPDGLNGAQVECVDGTSWNKDSAQVDYYLRTKTVSSLDLTAGAAYMLQGKRVMHRVSPMLHADTRKIICFTYATDAERHLVLEHGSMQDIYG